MKNYLLIGAVAIAASIALYFIFRDESEAAKGSDSCPPARNPKKFSEPWLEDKIPKGDLGALGVKYVKPILGGTDQENGSIIGGFFKGIDVYPSNAAAKYYKKWIDEYLNSDDALPYWNINQGEFLC